jgi:hypothetical protein
MPKLTTQEAAGRLLNYAFRFDHNDIKAIGNGGQKTLFNLPAGSAVLSCIVQKTVAVAGSTSLVFDIGTTGADPDEFIDALDADALSGATANTGDAFVQGAGTTTIKGGALPVSIVVAATPVLLEVNDATVASITAGEFVVSFLVLDFSAI